MSEYRKGILFAAASYLMWGLLPAYWKLIEGLSAYEILAHRIIWSLVFMIGLILVLGKQKDFFTQTKRLYHNKKSLISLILAAYVIAGNWGLFIWAVTNDHVLQASLGYYINPLMSILLGLFFMKERFTPVEWVAIILAFIGVLYMTMQLGVVPYISLLLAITFALYGLIKKNVHMDAIYTILLECLFTAPVALLYVGYLTINGEANFGMNPASMWLLLSGALTAIPLILFTAGARRIPLSLIGFLQYIGPSLMFIQGVFLFGETFTTTHLVTFGFIWLGLVLYSISKYMQMKLRRV